MITIEESAKTMRAISFKITPLFGVKGIDTSKHLLIGGRLLGLTTEQAFYSNTGEHRGEL
jgi:hypothetical protein